MANLYVAAWAPQGGKTTLCAGIGRHLKRRNKKVGYFKPLAPATGIDKDAQFIHQVLGLKEPVEALCPFTAEALISEDFPAKLLQAYSIVAKDKDIVLLEGLGGLVDDEILQASCQVADILDAKVVILVPYSTDLPWEGVDSCVGRFAPHLLGIVINRVPQGRIESSHTRMVPLFQREGIKVLGVLPEERRLLGVSVAELAEHLGAEVLCCPEASSELVENLMVGALSVDPGVDYFARKANKAVITRSDRPDIQLAALATSTRCLILAGGVAPIPQVLHWAEDKGTPILLAKQDVLSTLAEMEETFLQARFGQAKKLEKLEEILEQYLDLDTLFQSLER